MSAQPLARAFRQIGGMTAVSRVLGFARDVVFAAMLGAGPAADAFLVALKLPNMFRRLTAEGALSNAFVPAFARARLEDGDEAAMALAGETQTTLTMVLFALVILGEIFMPAVIGLLAPGFADTPDRMNAAIILARVTFPYLPMISLVAFWAAIANADGRFMTAAAMPVIFNTLLVGGALLIPVVSGWLAVEKAMPLAAALLVAGLLQIAVMARLLRRTGRMPAWRWPRFAAPVRAMWRQFSVASASAIALQVNLIVDLVLASLLPVGAISWLYFADRVAQLPLGIIGVALGTALLPRLSAQFREDDPAAARASLAEAVRLAAFLVVPAMVALIVIAPQIIEGLLGYGAFSQAAVAASASALAAYAIGMPAHILVKILQPAFYATGRGGFVLGVSIAAVFVNISLSITLMPVLGHVGLAFATSLSGLLAATALAAALARYGLLRPPPPIETLRSVVCCLVMAALLFGIGRALPALPPAAELGILVIGGGGGYLVAAAALGAVPRQLFWR